MDSYLTEVTEVSESVLWSISITALAEFKKERWKCKALCYEDTSAYESCRIL